MPPHYISHITRLIIFAVCVKLMKDLHSNSLHLNISASYDETVGDDIEPTPAAKGKAITFESSHIYNQSTECVRDASLKLLDHWRRSKETICSTHNLSIEKYVLDHWEYKPTIHVYRNIALNSLGDNVEHGSSSCGSLSQSMERTVGAATIIKHPVIRVHPFDPFNSYERFHAYLNVAMVMSMLNITNPQLVYMLNKKFKPDEIPDDELEMWESFSTLKPIIVAGHSSNATIPQNLTHIHYMVDFSVTGINNAAGTSILVTKTGGGLRGRGINHHCKSELFLGVIKWMRFNLLGASAAEPNTNENDTKIQIVWSSRHPYCCRPKGKIMTPTRTIAFQKDLVQKVQTSLGSQYNITIVNFGDLSAANSVRAASKSQIMVGVHGAGLVWSSFLKPHKPMHHAGLVELFGGNRGSGNRHYHNIASLADIHYRSLNLKGNADALVWDDRTVHQIVEKIQSIDFGREPEANDAN